LRILYGINTNGQGHINRARNLIKQFQDDGHIVDILYSGYPPPKYALSLAKNIKLTNGVRIGYQNHLVNIPKTIYNSVNVALNSFKTIKPLEGLFRKKNYTVIITDQEPYCSVIGWRSKIPTIAIDHQHSIIHQYAYSPNKKLIDKGFGILGIQSNIMHKDIAFAIDYVNKPTKVKDNILYPLIEKVDIPKENKFDEEDFILIYFNKSSLTNMVSHLKNFPNQRFKIYGFNKKKTIQNMEFQETGRKTFIEDLMKTKGIMASAGFSLTWECIQLDKPMYLIPQKHQYEQYVNSWRLEKLNYATYSYNFDIEHTNYFLKEFISSFRKNRIKLPIYPIRRLTNDVYRSIKYIEEHR
jgi:uncharacterized protein (TIGR00661 family)